VIELHLVWLEGGVAACVMQPFRLRPARYLLEPLARRLVVNSNLDAASVIVTAGIGVTSSDGARLVAPPEKMERTAIEAEI